MSKFIFLVIAYTSWDILISAFHFWIIVDSTSCISATQDSSWPCVQIGALCVQFLSSSANYNVSIIYLCPVFRTKQCVHIVSIEFILIPVQSMYRQTCKTKRLTTVFTQKKIDLPILKITYFSWKKNVFRYLHEEWCYKPL